MDDIVRRKQDHIEIVARGDGTGQATTGLEAIRFMHCALPELDLDAIDLGGSFLGHRFAAPLLISSMTGGPAEAGPINAALAEAAGALGVALAVGSQRVALERAGDAGFGPHLRQRLGTAMLLGNIGAAQLRVSDPVEVARRAVGMLEPDALIVHLNPLQEAVQQGGDRNWTGILSAIGRVAGALEVPLVVKEVGCGIAPDTARRLRDAGVAAIDCAGLGGTSWAQVEAERADRPGGRAIAAAFADWGIPTARALAGLRAALPDLPLIASGGIRDGLDCARAVRLGAGLVGQAAGLLAAARSGPEAVTAHLQVVIEQLRVACFCTGSANLTALSRAPLLDAPTFVAA